MKDPYEVLGVGRNTPTDEIKSKYRELTRKYHPDKYAGNELADLAQEKMKEINEAYDTIMRERSGQQQSYQGQQQNRGPYGYSPYGQQPYGQQQPYGGGGVGMSPCDCCAGLMCADCLCSSLRCC